MQGLSVKYLCPENRPESHVLKPLHQTLRGRLALSGKTYKDVHAALELRPYSIGVLPPSLAVVGHWLNGTRRPRNMEHLRALCDVVGVSLDEATGGMPQEAVTAVEQRLLQLTRQLDDLDAEMLLGIAERMSQREKT